MTVTVRRDDVFTGSASYYAVHINQVLAAPGWTLESLQDFTWSMSELREDRSNWADNYTVQITMDDEAEPGKIWMVFTRDDGGN